MTYEFIEAHCVGCDYCIYSDGNPSFCGEIDEGGCVSTELKRVVVCREGHAPIPHIPRYKAGDRLETSCGIYKILGIEEDRYVMQREGVFGRFDEPYPVERQDTEEIDYCYELYQEEDV